MEESIDVEAPCPHTYNGFRALHQAGEEQGIHYMYVDTEKFEEQQL